MRRTQPRLGNLVNISMTLVDNSPDTVSQAEYIAKTLRGITDSRDVTNLTYHISQYDYKTTHLVFKWEERVELPD